MFYSFVKYSLLVVMTVMSIIGVADWEWNSGFLKRWKEKKPWRKIVFWVVIVIVPLTIWAEYETNRQSEAERNALNGRIETLRQIQELTKADMEVATNELATTRAELRDANRQIAEQSRHIGSLVYNIRTSFEGKTRFAKCFEDLSDMTSNAFYEPLICEDGVAVFRFQRSDDALKGFYFFTNSEVNEVLSGVPMDYSSTANATNVVFDVNSEVAKAMECFSSRKTPEWQTDPAARERAAREIFELVRLICRYVYRSKRTSVGLTKPPGWHIIISYEVDPFADEPCTRSVSLNPWTEDFVRSLHGLTMQEFTERVLDQFGRNGIAPKIRVKDIRHLNRIAIENESWNRFPYRGKGSVK